MRNGRMVSVMGAGLLPVGLASLATLEAGWVRNCPTWLADWAHVGNLGPAAAAPVAAAAAHGLVRGRAGRAARGERPDHPPRHGAAPRSGVSGARRPGRGRLSAGRGNSPA